MSWSSSPAGEEVAVAEYLGKSAGVHMPKGATLDGGDVVFYDDRYLIGLSTRTNKPELTSLLAMSKRKDMM